jgi:hypothetical protein
VFIRRLVTFPAWRTLEPQNEHDGVLMGVHDPAARARLIVPLRPAAEPNALVGTFDIVIG